MTVDRSRPFPKVRIRVAANGIAQGVTLDGIVVPGVRSVETSHPAQTMPVVRIEIYSDDIEYERGEP